MDLQQTFDRVCEHLMAQGLRSMTPAGSACAYRGTGGAQCAVGCLIDDAHYAPRLEGSPIGSSPAVHQALSLSGVRMADPAMRSLLGALQAVHDTASVECWPDQLAYVAREHGLTVPACVAPLPDWTAMATEPLPDWADWPTALGR